MPLSVVSMREPGSVSMGPLSSVSVFYAAFLDSSGTDVRGLAMTASPSAIASTSYKLFPNPSRIYNNREARDE